MKRVATLELNNKNYELPLIVGTEQEIGIDITNLRVQANAVTLDNGFMNTASCQSKVTFLNGEKGILRYRGYPIDQLATHSRFIEVAYLLNYGHLPTAKEIMIFEEKISEHSVLIDPIKNILDQFPLDAHPMGVVSSTVSSLSAFYPELMKANVVSEDIDLIIPKLMGEVKAITSYFYRRVIGQPVLNTNPKIGYAADLVNMMFYKNKALDVKISEALDTLLILHADHEQNCSASAVRVVGSSYANIFAVISAGINALWGELHGGANQAVLEMLENISKNGGDYKYYLEKAKDRKDPFKLMGFGHRVYKNFDPRSLIIKESCDKILKKLHINDPLLEIAINLEKEVLKDDYFIERSLYPNVDFYSGLIYKALGIPTNMFTVMFVIGRLPGWLAQWKEMRENKTLKIARPRQIYTGETKRDYVKIDQR